MASGVQAPGHAIKKLDPKRGPLQAQLAAEAVLAARLGHKLVSMTYAAWCPGTVAVVEHAAHPEMASALAGVTLLVVDIDLDWPDFAACGFQQNLIPVLQPVAPEGRVEGPSINGGAWGADTPENMAPVLRNFFASLPAPAAPPKRGLGARQVALLVLSLLLLVAGVIGKDWADRRAAEKARSEELRQQIRESIQKNVREAMKNEAG